LETEGRTTSLWVDEVINELQPDSAITVSGKASFTAVAKGRIGEKNIHVSSRSGDSTVANQSNRRSKQTGFGSM